MEAFSLLKYWRGGGLGGAGAGAGDNGANLRTKNETTTTIVTAIANHAVDTDDDEGDGDDDDDGPFFDLEFTVPDDDDAEDNKNNNEENSSEEDEENDDVVSDDDDVGTDGDEREFKFTLSSNSSNDRTDPNLTLSPSDDLFFKGRLVPIEPSLNGSEPNSKPQFPVSLLKSATKFRVFMLGFKKSKPNANEKTETNGSAAAPKQQQQQQKPEDTQQEEDNNSNNKKESNKFFTVKFKVEEVPIMSLFTRDNSSRNSSTNNKSQKQNSTSSDDSASDEKKFSKDVMQKYLKKVKPLYIRVSKRYGEKLRFSGQLSLGSGPKPSLPPPPPPPQSTVAQKTVKSTAEKSQSEAESAEAPVMSNVKSLKQANIPAGLRVVCKHLGKSRSASSAVAAAPPGSVPSRRDDSLLEQQDGIQSAILHCKRSFNASRDCESTLLSRSVSDPSREKSIDLSRKKSSDKGKINIFDAEGIL